MNTEHFDDYDLKINLLIRRYKIGSDPADLLNVDEKTGMIKVKSQMDRESQFWSTVVQNRNGQYKALILAMDDGTVCF